MSLLQDINCLICPGKFPFYAKMFADAGFPLTASQMISDSLIDSLIVSGNEDTVASQFTKLLTGGLDELYVGLVPIIDADNEQSRLVNLIGQL